jgi:4-amino-4-deoxy-L-arabinose transferase-like glycosyltransferase
MRHQRIPPTAWLLILLFLAALTLRAARSDLMEFKHDEAVAWLRAHALAQGGEFPCRGLVSSRGVDNFPLFLYLLAAMERLFTQPHQLVWPIAFLNSLSVFFIFSSIHRLYGRRAAWMTTLLYAFSPCAIAFSRKIWAQDLLPFWVTALFFLAVQMMMSRQSRTKAWCGFAFGLLATTAWQIHYSALFLCCGYLFFFIFYYRFLRPLPLAAMGAGIMVGLLPAIPYFLQGGWSSLPVPRHLPDSLASGLHWRPKDLLNFFIRQPIDETYYALLGPEYKGFVQAIPGYNSLRYLLCLFVLGGMALCFWRLMRQSAKRNSQRAGLIAVLTLLPLLILGLSRFPLIPSYFIVFYPLPFLFPALLIDKGWRCAQRSWGPVIAGRTIITLFTVIIVYQIIFQGAFLSRIAGQGGASGEYGIAYADQAQATRWIMEHEAWENCRRSLKLAALAIALGAKNAQSYPSLPEPWPRPKSLESLDHGNSQDRIFMLNRLTYPELDKHTQPWVLWTGRSTHLLQAPAASAHEILKRYPGPKLTPRQAAEEEKGRILALKVLDVAESKSQPPRRPEAARRGAKGSGL